ncbi:MAG: RhuM family protein [Desulfobacterales bacterium]
MFQTTKQNVGSTQKIFSEGELSEKAVVKKFFTTAADGKKYKINFYNLDAIISVGYRIKSHVATRVELDKLLVEKLSEALTAEQKKNFVTNLLQEMRRGKIIQPVKGKRGRGTEWELYKTVKKGTA